ncbi:helix-turn-helix domain-containing protein [Hydrogenivirga sp. 128-5-R1-1]|uniref:helix-turn-helix domain-containing protein n=1 Tax=Hydrogenivirga sp. 128-5-R1-1 TaxID=392423 RepID=UPI00015EF945|nr:helix-turn-helix domain-containing protein [Hydrogenivirga sp. 128-5-R1-1]EDP73581.1 hypothetical protein HG1285_00035 [Hydrogenivirga sp. 128-5-R1-1]
MTGKEIRELRKKLGLTQEEFAQLLGVGFTTVNRWENGKSEPRGQALEALEKLRTLIEEAEEGKDFTIEDLKEILKDIESGRLVSNLSGVIPKSVLGLVAAGGIVGFLTGLSTAFLIKKFSEGKKKKKD